MKYYFVNKIACWVFARGKHKYIILLHKIQYVAMETNIMFIKYNFVEAKVLFMYYILFMTFSYTSALLLRIAMVPDNFF